jgi:putative membrane protein
LLIAAADLFLVHCKNGSPDVGSDSNIAASLVAANSGEVQIGMLAQSQGMNAAVKDFANRMINEHTAAQQRQSALFTSLGLTPADDTTSRQLQSDAQNMLAMLRTRTGQDFDLAYVDGQISMHMGVLDLLTSRLIPAATEDELRQELNQMRDTVSAHLQAAQALRATLGPGGSDGGVTDGSTPNDGMTDGSTPNDAR